MVSTVRERAPRWDTSLAPHGYRRAPAKSPLLGLTTQVLDLSKTEAGKPEPTPQPAKLTSLNNEFSGPGAQLANKKKNRLVVDAQENLGALTVDPMRL